MQDSLHHAGTLLNHTTPPERLRVAGEELRAFTDAERAWIVMADRESFKAHLESLDRDRQEDVIAALENYEDKYQPEQVVPGTIVLLNLMPDLPDRPRGMFTMDTRLVVGRVTFRLLRSLGDPDAVAAAAREILPEVTSLSSKFELITDVGYREGAGHKLVSESVAEELESEWRADVRATAVDDLIRETELLRVAIFARRDLRDGEPNFEIAADNAMTLALLRAAKSEVRSQSMGSRSVRRSWHLAWETLVDLYGDEATLKARIDTLKTETLPDDKELLDLADKYVGGWRPKDFS